MMRHAVHTRVIWGTIAFTLTLSASVLSLFAMSVVLKFDMSRENLWRHRVVADAINVFVLIIPLGLFGTEVLSNHSWREWICRRGVEWHEMQTSFNSGFTDAKRN